MSEYQTLRPAPGEPPEEIEQNALPWRSPVDNEPNWTGVQTDADMRARELEYRDMPVTEALEVGSAHRSDRRPHNFRVAEFFIPDALASSDFDFHVSFPVWAIEFVQLRRFDAAGNSIGPFGYGMLNPYNTQFFGRVNLPHSFASISGHYEGNPGFNPGTGYYIWAYDRWIP